MPAYSESLVREIDMTDPQTKDQKIVRTVLVTTPPTRWVMEVEEDWDALNEDERQAFIWDAAMDNDKMPRFKWEKLPEGTV